jgi:AbrB family looped-hinge helix DNA binding protein
MSTMTVSSKGQVVLPTSIRKRLGLFAGSQLQVFDEPDGIRLVVARPVKATSIVAFADMVSAPRLGKPRRLSEFDAATTFQARAK